MSSANSCINESNNQHMNKITNFTVKCEKVLSNSKIIIAV